MRKKRIILLMMIFGLFLFSVTPTRSIYYGTPGYIYYYDLLINKVDLKLGSNSYSGNGITFVGHKIAIPQNYVSIEINTATSSYMTSTLTIGSYSGAIYSEWLGEDENDFYALILYPMTLCDNFLSNPTTAEDGFGLVFLPFVDTTATFDMFTELIAKTRYQLTILTPSIGNPVFEATGGLSGSVFTFDSHFTGNITSTGSPSYEVSYDTLFKCIYDYDLGILQGMHYWVHIDGVFNGQDCSITCEALVEAYSYNLPGFAFGGFNIADDWWIIVAAGGGGLLLIVLTAVIATRAKKKKKPKKSKKKSSKKRKK